MRADRLVAVLLMLQTKGRVTAAEVAAELEVSERTARRDLDALGMAGLPVYAVRGRGGGWRLAGGGRTDLSGLSAAEARALFALAGPRAATPEVKAALRKLLRALPEPLRARAAAATARVMIDPVDWDRATRPRPPSHLEALEAATIEGEQVVLGYVARDGAATTRRVHPLGLAAKGTTWYLFAATDAGLRAFRIDRVTSVEPTGEPTVRPDGFDLSEEWARFVEHVDHMRTPVIAEAVVSQEMLGPLRAVLGTRVSTERVRGDRAVPHGWVSVRLRGHSIRSLAAEVAGFGAHLEVHEPTELRTTLAEIGSELMAAYGSVDRRPSRRLHAR